MSRTALRNPNKCLDGISELQRSVQISGRWEDVAWSED